MDDEEFEPPRAQKKYSKSWESTLDRFTNGMEVQAPHYLKPSFIQSRRTAVTAVVLSIIPGLGTYYLSRKTRLPLLQFGGWLALLLLHALTRSSIWGWLFSIVIFCYHQFLLLRSYLEGLMKEGTPIHGPYQGLAISVVMAVALFFLYLLFSVFTWNSLLSLRG
jgi:hypothetical protein